MGLTSAMYTALSGLNANQMRIDTIGHNIANVNTNAFKGSRTLFQTQFAQTLSMGTPPGDTSGGTNPLQIGHGVLVGSTQRNLSEGSLETTGLPSDLAVDGAGYFVVRDGQSRQVFTRDGAFSLNAGKQLVTPNGQRVQGFGVDGNFAIIPGTLQDLRIPLGTTSIARATQNAILGGDLSAAESTAVTGSETKSQALVAGGGAAATADTALTDLRSATVPDTALFAAGDQITVSGATKGEREIAGQQFVVGTTGNTLGDLASWLQNVLGIQTGTGLPGNPGVVVEDGALVVRSNAGQPNAIDLSAGDVTSSGTARSPTASRPWCAAHRKSFCGRTTSACCATSSWRHSRKSSATRS